MGAKQSRPAQPFPAFVRPAEPVSKERKTVAYIIANPKSGGNKGLTTAEYVAGKIREAGLTAHLMFTTHAGHAKELAAGLAISLFRTKESEQRHPGIADSFTNTDHVFVSVGGDGTANEVLNGMSYACLGANEPLFPLCLVPCGSGNTLAFNIGIFTADDSLAGLLSKNIRRIDLLQCTHPEDTSLPLLAGTESGASDGTTTGAAHATTTSTITSTAATAAVESEVAGVPGAGAMAATTSGVLLEVPSEKAKPFVLDSEVITVLGRQKVAEYINRAQYSCNILAWGLGTAVLVRANDLRCCGGAQYNCAAYTELVYNNSYLASIEWVRPAAPIEISSEAYAAARAQVAAAKGLPPSPSAAGETVADGRPLVPVQGVSGQVTPYVIIDFQNTCYMGSKMAFCPFARLDDGLMDICAVAADTRSSLVSVMESAKDMGGHLLDKISAAQPHAKRSVTYAQAEEIIFRPLTQECIDAWRRGDTLNELGTTILPSTDAAGRRDAAAAERRRLNVHSSAMIGDRSMNIDGELHGFSPARVKTLKRALRVVCNC